jgi:transposase
MRLLFVKRLTRNERDVVYPLIDNKEIGYRALIIALSYDGYEVREIARRLNLHPVNVRKWIRRFNKEGVKCLYSRGGRKKKLDKHKEKKILMVAIKKPYKLGLPFSSWSLRKLEYYVKNRLKTDVSYVQIRNILLKYGLGFRKARKKLFSDDPEYEAKMARIRRLLKKPNCVVLFTDQKLLVAKEYLGYEWCFKARIVKANEKIKGKVYSYGFFNPHNKFFHARFFKNLSKKNFYKCLRWISKKMDDIIYIILDNASIHPNPKIKSDMERLPGNVRLVFLPKHSPKDNRTEDVHSLIQKEVLDNRRFSNIKEVILAVKKWIRNYNRKSLK